MNGQGEKPFYKRTWVVLLAMAICFLYIGNYKTKDKKTSKSTSNESASTQASNDIGQKLRKWVGETGNLHKATVRTWHNSTYSNRWHTASDWFIAITKASNPELQRKLDKLNIEQWLATVQECSRQLEECVSEITSDKKLWVAESLVAEIASDCYIHMYMGE